MRRAQVSVSGLGASDKAMELALLVNGDKESFSLSQVGLVWEPPESASYVFVGEKLVALYTFDEKEDIKTALDTAEPIVVDLDPFARSVEIPADAFGTSSQLNPEIQICLDLGLSFIIATDRINDKEKLLPLVQAAGVLALVGPGIGVGEACLALQFLKKKLDKGERGEVYSFLDVIEDRP